MCTTTLFLLENKSVFDTFMAAFLTNEPWKHSLLIATLCGQQTLTDLEGTGRRFQLAFLSVIMQKHIYVMCKQICYLSLCAYVTFAGPIMIAQMFHANIFNALLRKGLN